MLGTAHQPADGGHHLIGLGVALFGGSGADHAMMGVIVQQPERDLVQRRLGGADLGKDVDAIPIVLDHLLDPANLPFDPA